jgi:hypothetical protein
MLTFLIMAAVNWNDADCQTLIHTIESLPVLWKTDFKNYGKRGPRYTEPGRQLLRHSAMTDVGEILWICGQHMTYAAHRLHNYVIISFCHKSKVFNSIVFVNIS